MEGALVIIGMGCALIIGGFVSARNVVNNGFYSRGYKSKWVLPTSPLIAKALIFSRMLAIVGLVIVGLGVWLIVAPDSLFGVFDWLGIGPQKF
jgi:hypothetical protein